MGRFYLCSKISYYMGRTLTSLAYLTLGAQGLASLGLGLGLGLTCRDLRGLALVTLGDSPCDLTGLGSVTLGDLPL